ncbi:hypothetical protein TRIP_D300134 [uncultured Paludibacter sp.]|uniref:Uncharacterized protein n=1 Tax=uncultured Paludibacter sp. TaxID=497635 RepID=A0A653AB41_9BACT|nr:hypothetical protein TRIP_D300134 [uncultured Paludibacter sp.]
MFIVQNTAYFPLTLIAEDRRANFSLDKLKGKRINKIMAYALVEDYPIDLPIRTGFSMLDFSEIGILSLFLNLTDIENNNFVEDYDFRSSLISTKDNNSFIELLINRILNFEQSFISFKGELRNNIITLPLFFFYQTKKLKPFSDEINGSISVTYTPTQGIEDIQLSSKLIHALQGKLIKKIYASGENSDITQPAGYLDLICRDGKHIENLPIDFLRTKSPKDLWFDLLDIDFEKSYYKHRSMDIPENALTLTFIY